MPRIELQGVEQFYPGESGLRIPGVRALDLTIEHGELLMVLGASGSGKTTLLRLIAGLERPSAGVLRFDGTPVTTLPAAERDVGMVFQRPALFPHLTVRENLALSLRLRQAGAEVIRGAVLGTARSLGVQELLDRLPGQLSGGEQQRVALGRAVVRHPRILLLDEPLSNLDRPLRRRLRSDIFRLHREQRLTTVYVTHDLQDVAGVETRVAVMESGRVVQTGPLQELQSSPRSPAVAELVCDK